MDGRTHQIRGGARAVLADREPMVRGAIKDLATQSLGMQVVGEATDAATLEQLVHSLRPDLVIVAWNLVVASAVKLLGALRCSCAGLRIVVLGLRPETRQEALAAGADAYICMVDAPDVVAAALLPGADDAGSSDIEPERRSASGGISTEPRGVS